MILINDIEVKPTIFPDGTSQVWKLDIETIKTDARELYDGFTTIQWYYEQEVELIWINQLLCLMYQSGIKVDELNIPYLPYGRQDKCVSNESTFAKEVFLEILLKEYVGEVTTFDAHSYTEGITSYTPEYSIQSAIEQYCDPFDYDSDLVLVFPDKGAQERYSDILYTGGFIIMDKVRNQLTGKIESLVISNLGDVVIDGNTKFLIVDDISDYGNTFVMAAKTLKSTYPNNDIALYVSHFLGHGGNNRLYDAGISKIFTTDSLTPYRKFRGIVDDERVVIV